MKVNLTDTRLEDFKPGMTVYVQRGRSDEPTRTYLCKFVRMDRGIVALRTISSNVDYGRPHESVEIRCRAKSCYLWGYDKKDKHWPRCHWYDKVRGWK